MRKLEASLSEMKDIIGLTYSNEMDSKYCQDIKLLEATFKIFIDGSHNIKEALDLYDVIEFQTERIEYTHINFPTIERAQSSISVNQADSNINFRASSEPNIKIQTLSRNTTVMQKVTTTDCLNPSKIKVYLANLLKSQGMDMAIAAFNYMLVVRAKYLLLNCTFYMYKSNPLCVENEFTSFNKDYDGYMKIYASLFESKIYSPKDCPKAEDLKFLEKEDQIVKSYVIVDNDEDDDSVSNDEVAKKKKSSSDQESKLDIS